MYVTRDPQKHRDYELIQPFKTCKCALNSFFFISEGVLVINFVHGIKSALTKRYDLKWNDKILKIFIQPPNLLLNFELFGIVKVV